jgi:hypothetical protein
MGQREGGRRFAARLRKEKFRGPGTDAERGPRSFAGLVIERQIAKVSRSLIDREKPRQSGVSADSRRRGVARRSRSIHRAS